MSNIIQFPKVTKPPPAQMAEQPRAAASSSKSGKASGLRVLPSLIRFVWVVTVLVWPILKWLIAIEVFFQFVRMLYHWSSPGMYAGWTFLLHFGVLTALTYFVSIYKPKGI